MKAATEDQSAPTHPAMCNGTSLREYQVEKSDKQGQEDGRARLEN